MDNRAKAASIAAGLTRKRGEQDWHSIEKMWEVLEAMCDDGATVVVKLDGERNPPDRYTVVISGGPLKEKYFRLDSQNLEEALCAAVIFFDREIWHETTT